MADSKITLDQVQHVARLARLELTPDDEAHLEADLSSILGYIDKLNQLDTSAVDPTAQVGDAGTPMRDDAITNQPDPERMVENAPSRRDHFIRVPKIIE